MDGQNHLRHGIWYTLTTSNNHNIARFRSLHLGRWFPEVLFPMTSIYLQNKLLLFNLLGLLVDEWLYPHRLVQWTVYSSCQPFLLLMSTVHLMITRRRMLTTVDQHQFWDLSVGKWFGWSGFRDCCTDMLAVAFAESKCVSVLISLTLIHIYTITN